MKKLSAILLGTFCIGVLMITGCGSKDEEKKESYVATDCVTLPEYKGLEVDCSVTEEEIQSKVDDLIAQNETTKAAKVVKKNYTANIDYEGKVDGKVFDGGSAKGHDLLIGSGQFIDGFEDGLIGAKKGDKKVLNLKFPKDYSVDKKLANKKVVFTVKVNKITQTITPKLTDAFIKKATSKDAVKYTTIKAYKEGAKKTLMDSKKEAAGSSAFNQIVEKATFVTIPAIVVSECATSLDEATRSSLTASGQDFDTMLSQYGMNLAQYNEYINMQAESTAKARLCWEAVAAKEKITVSDKEVSDAIAKIQTQMKASTVEELRKIAKEQYGISDLDADMRQNTLLEKVYAKLKDYAKIKTN